MAGWLSRIGIQDHAQPGDGTLVKLPFTAHVTDPRRKVGDHDQFLAQPCEIGDMTQVHHASGTFTAGE